MKGFKIVTIIFAIIYLASLFAPVIVGCTFDTTTLYWINITGFDLLDYHPASLLMIAAVALTLFITLIHRSRNVRILWVLLLAGIGGWAYVVSLTSVWSAFRQFAEDVSLHPGCVIPPMMIMLVANTAISTIWTENYYDEQEHDYDEFAESIE